MKLIHQILGLILGFIIGILTTLSGLGLLGLWVYSDTKKNPPSRQYKYGSKSKSTPEPEEKKDIFPLDYVYQTSVAAENVLRILKSYIEIDGKVSLSHLKSASGFSPNLVDRNYGWEDLSEAHVVADRMGYMIRFPELVYLKKNP